MLSKLPWADVKKEMTEEKGLDSSVADRIGEYVKLQGVGSEGVMHCPPSIQELLLTTILT
jgi:hypothetical protein